MQIGVDPQRAVESKRVFIVDADDIAATALQFMLADEMEVQVMSRTAEAIAHPSAGAVDVVLLGSGSVEAEGDAAVQALMVALPGVPVLVCGPAGDAGVLRALALGARSSIARPFKLEAVRQKVNAQIGRRAMLSIPVVVASR